MNSLTFEEKLDLVIKALYEAKMITADNEDIKVYQRDSNGLTKLISAEIKTILHKLETDNKIIEVVSVPERGIRNARNYFTIKLLEGFDGWYDTWLLDKKSSLEYIDYINLLKIYDVILDIDEKLQLAGKTDITIPALPHIVRFQILFPVDSLSMRDTYINSRWDAVIYLQGKGVVSEPAFIRDDLDLDHQLEMKVILPKFEALKTKARLEYIKRNEKSKSEKKADQVKSENVKKEVVNDTSEDKEKTLYEVRYVKNAIDINGKYFSKTTFNGENDLVFDLVYRNPNKTYTRKQVEVEICQDLKKELDKIVENLGFISELRRAFFDVSSKAIRFRNPVTDKLAKEEKLNIEKINEILNSPKQS
jgi:hypothetical protein